MLHRQVVSRNHFGTAAGLVVRLIPLSNCGNHDFTETRPWTEMHDQVSSALVARVYYYSVR